MRTQVLWSLSKSHCVHLWSMPQLNRAAAGLSTHHGPHQWYQDGGAKHTSQRLPLWQAAAAAMGGALVAAAAASPFSLADSSSLQMQQTLAADHAAANSSAQLQQAHVNHSAPLDSCGPSSSRSSMLGGLLQYLSDATDYTVNLLADVMEHTETRYACSTCQAHSRLLDACMPGMLWATSRHARRLVSPHTCNS
jgi:hypothetical protein